MRLIDGAVVTNQGEPDYDLKKDIVVVFCDLQFMFNYVKFNI